MSLKYDSPKKIRKRRSKWKVQTGEEFEEREYQLLKDSQRENAETIIGQVRVTAGKAKNVKLDIPKRTRPLTDRMKTQIFDTLSKDIVGRKVLDLFAGSGSFGLEALSRGAESVVFVDASKYAEKVLGDNIARTGFIAESIVVKEKADEFLRKAISDETIYDLVFLDPPYKDYNKKKTHRIADLLNNVSKLLPGLDDKDFPGAMIVKHPRNFAITEIEVKGMKILETHTYGMNAITLYIFT